MIAAAMVAAYLHWLAQRLPWDVLGPLVAIVAVYVGLVGLCCLVDALTRWLTASPPSLRERD